MAALPVKLLLVFCALQLLLITSVTACENDSTDASGDGECTDKRPKTIGSNGWQLN